MKLTKLLAMIFIVGCGINKEVILSKGLDGVNGTNGAAGRDGANGLDGKDGANGLNGRDGVDGLNGSNGASCSVTPVSPSLDAPNGGALITCGSTYTLVTNGLDGQQGAQGIQGVAGQNGIDGRDGVDGKDGVDGLNGAAGRDGLDGHDGATGATGATGSQGPSGSVATVTSYSSSSCAAINGSSSYTKPSGNSYKVYSDSSCSNQVEVISSGQVFILGNLLLIWSSSGLKVISFN